MDFNELFTISKEESLYGRYITLKHITPLIDKLKDVFQVDVAGFSVRQQPIYKIIAGSGGTKIYIWSQMHGNESTTTKAIFDFLNFLQRDNEFAATLKENFTFCILPMANPDGAATYTRVNANNVDLNRDAANLSQPESQVLREIFKAFKPHYAYNMHDQRSIFGVGNTGKPATVSFLAPSYNEERDINDNRRDAINIIAGMNATLQHYIPGQVGRFDDSFNINCIGDMFQSLGVTTVLFEAGHYKDDYIREKTRKFIFIALLSGFKHINENVIVSSASDDYFEIPQNKITFYDFIYKKVKINYENREKITNFASHYKEELIEDNVKFRAFISEIGDLSGFYGHTEYDCEGAEFSRTDGATIPQVDEKADFIIGLNRKFVNGIEVK